MFTYVAAQNLSKFTVGLAILRAKKSGPFSETQSSAYWLGNNSCKKPVAPDALFSEEPYAMIELTPPVAI